MPLLFQDKQKSTSWYSDDLRLILGYINEHRAEEITRKRISKAVGISESAVSHIFTNIVGMSLPEYIKSIRVCDAAKLLCQTKYSVTQIAEISGFGSIRSFNRAFLEHFHLSPLEYRNKYKNCLLMLSRQFLHLLQMIEHKENPSGGFQSCAAIQASVF